MANKTLNGVSNKINVIYNEKYFNSEKSHFLDLFDKAICALEKEDSKLNKLFEESELKGFYDNCSKGLSYWLFETTIVYIIFKSWIPNVKVVWEGSYFDTPRKEMLAHKHQYSVNKNQKKADLIIYGNDNEKEAIIEAKWWLCNNKKTLISLNDDINKLNKVNNESIQKYLLTFWYSPNEAYEDDIKDTKDFENNEKVKRIYFAKFPTDWVKNKKHSNESYFAMTIFNV